MFPLTIPGGQGDGPGAVQVVGVSSREARTQDHARHGGQRAPAGCCEVDRGVSSVGHRPLQGLLIHLLSPPSFGRAGPQKHISSPLQHIQHTWHFTY